MLRLLAFLSKTFKLEKLWASYRKKKIASAKCLVVVVECAAAAVHVWRHFELAKQGLRYLASKKLTSLPSLHAAMHINMQNIVVGLAGWLVGWKSDNSHRQSATGRHTKVITGVHMNNSNNNNMPRHGDKSDKKAI